MHRESGAGSYRRFPKTAVETDGGAVRALPKRAAAGRKRF